MVLSDRRGHLQALAEHLAKHNFTDVGYYIGGMKEAELKESESRRILLGTYMMSSEGMDIPILNTLVMASPKSNIEQSVGRILRKEHEGVEPVIYDVVDDFSVFRNQAEKRKKFYRVAGYQVFNSCISDHSDTPLPKLWSQAEASKTLLETKSKRTKSKSKPKSDRDKPASESVCLI